MICNKCGSQIRDGVKFCPSCGNKIEAAPAGGNPQGALVCSCGNQLRPGAKFCNACGKKVEAAPAPAGNIRPIQPLKPLKPQNESKPEAKTEEGLVCSCGNKLKPGAKFCNACGKKVEAAPAPAPAPAPVPAPAEPEKPAEQPKPEAKTEDGLPSTSTLMGEC